MLQDVPSWRTKELLDFIKFDLDMITYWGISVFIILSRL